jgi:membrane fusion protein (multidrug efflux system)
VDDAKAAVSVQQAALEITQGQLTSANAQKESVQQQANIVKTKGTADIEASRAKMEQAQASYDYAAANTSQKSAYAQSISALRSSVDAARAALNSAKAKRADTVLISPLDGFVTGRYVDPGAVITPGQAILGVQFVKQVWVTISVPEEISAQVHIGQPAKVEFDALPGQTFFGNVVQFNPSADLQSRQFMARVILSNTQNLFKPGMFAHVSIETENIKGALSVPREAIQQSPAGPTVTVVEIGNKAKRVPVTIGVSDDNFTAIEQGLRPGQKVVIMSTFPVRDGATLRLAGKRGRGPHPNPLLKGEGAGGKP